MCPQYSFTTDIFPVIDLFAGYGMSRLSVQCHKFHRIGVSPICAVSQIPQNFVSRLSVQCHKFHRIGCLAICAVSQIPQNFMSRLSVHCHKSHRTCVSPVSAVSQIPQNGCLASLCIVTNSTKLVFRLSVQCHEFQRMEWLACLQFY